MTIAKTFSSLAAVALLGTLAAAGASAQQPAPYNPPGYERGRAGSNRNLRRVDRQLGRAIATMQHDQHDYDGHRVRAIQDLQNAQSEIKAAEAYARTHGY